MVSSVAGAKLQLKKAPVVTYENFYEPTSTGAGIVFAFIAGIAAFAIIWHVWWLAAFAVAALIVAIIIRSQAEGTERLVTADEVRALVKAQV
jgi:cytochrome o ubiquinol oxidase subunit I